MGGASQGGDAAHRPSPELRAEPKKRRAVVLSALGASPSLSVVYESFLVLRPYAFLCLSFTSPQPPTGIEDAPPREKRPLRAWQGGGGGRKRRGDPIDRSKWLPGFVAEEEGEDPCGSFDGR